MFNQPNHSFSIFVQLNQVEQLDTKVQQWNLLPPHNYHRKLKILDLPVIRHNSTDFIPLYFLSHQLM